MMVDEQIQLQLKRPLHKLSPSWILTVAGNQRK